MTEREPSATPPNLRRAPRRLSYGSAPVHSRSRNPASAADRDNRGALQVGNMDSLLQRGARKPKIRLFAPWCSTGNQCGRCHMQAERRPAIDTGEDGNSDGRPPASRCDARDLPLLLAEAGPAALSSGIAGSSKDKAI